MLNPNLFKGKFAFLLLKQEDVECSGYCRPTKCRKINTIQ